MNPKLFGILFILLLPAAFGLTLDTGKDKYSKGSEISLFGTCGQTVSITFTANEKKLDSFSAECNNGSYIYQQNASLLYPTGTLQITATESGETKTKTISILSTRESGFLSITFLSATNRELHRGETIELTVQVNNAENPSENAVVQTWLPNGNPITLSKTSQPGIYSAQIAISPDTPLANWNAIVTATNQDQNQTVGGEQKTVFSIASATIQIQVLSPQTTNIGTNEKTTLTIKATYADGKTLEQPAVQATIAGKTFLLTPQNENTFSLPLEFSPEQTGLLQIEITVTDKSQNTTTKKIDFFITQNATGILIANLPLIVLAILLLIGVWFFVIPKIRGKKTASQLQKRKSQLEKEIAELQTNYFEKASIPKEKFTQKNAELQAELADTTKKLKNTAP